MKIVIEFFKKMFKIKLFSKNKQAKIAINTEEKNNPENNYDYDIAKQLQRDPHYLIIQQSNKHLNDLKIFVNYFKDSLLDKVYLQTQIIHNVFAENKELNHKKLEQFHYYYTVHLLELLSKVKKKHNEKFTIINSKIKTLKEHLGTLQHRISEIENSHNGIKKNNHMFQYASYMELQLCAIYNCLCSQFDDFRFKPKDKFITFTSQYGLITAWQLSDTLFKQLIVTDTANKLIPYTYKNFTIDRKLLGILNKHQYRVKFIGVICNHDTQYDDYYELFTISDTQQYFIYYHHGSIFKMIKYSEISEYLVDSNTELYTRLKNIEKQENEIQEYENQLKTSIDTSLIQDALQKYLDKTLDTELMTDYSQIDLHRKNLEAILDLERTVI